MITWGLVDMFWALIYVAGVFAIMFFLNARLAFLLLLIVPCIAVLTVFFQNRILHWNGKVSVRSIHRSQTLIMRESLE